MRLSGCLIGQQGYAGCVQPPNPVLGNLRPGRYLLWRPGFLPFDPPPFGDEAHGQNPWVVVR